MNSTAETTTPRFQAVEWKLLSDLIESRLGLVFNEARREILEARLKPRLKALRLHAFSEYYHYLLFHPDGDEEFRRITGNLTNGETYFFREKHQFEVLEKHVLEQILANLNGRPLRILSAGCSSGQEPYSIAMVLSDALSKMPLRGWEIHACDINEERLARGVAAVYEENSFRGCDEETRERFFEPVDGGYRVRPVYRTGVRFFHANLACERGDDWPVYDVIFCRNMLIYFSDEAFHSAIELFSRRLAPGGFLFLGHSESLINKSSDFQPVCLGGKIVYRKQGG